jgi:hypothetical protein
MKKKLKPAARASLSAPVVSELPAEKISLKKKEWTN